MKFGCSLCINLLPTEAFDLHSLHGEALCEWAEVGSVERKMIEEREDWIDVTDYTCTSCNGDWEGFISHINIDTEPCLKSKSCSWGERCYGCRNLRPVEAYKRHSDDDTPRCETATRGRYLMLAYELQDNRRRGLTVNNYVTKDSGERQDFTSGAKRDTQSGKSRYDLIPPGPLKRLADLYARGAEKYGEANWQKGMPTSRMLASLMRHLESYRLGDREEDHLAAVVWNAFAIMHFENTDWHDYDETWMK